MLTIGNANMLMLKQVVLTMFTILVQLISMLTFVDVSTKPKVQLNQNTGQVEMLT